jgi:cobalt-zinc-cadmium efflux system outer membrane protein
LAVTLLGVLGGGVQDRAYAGPASSPSHANAGEAPAPNPIEVPKELTLRDAVALALTNSPELAAFEWKIRAAEAHALQAGLRKNPELSLEVEDIRWRDAPDSRSKSTTYSFDGKALTASRDRSTDHSKDAGFGESQATLRLVQVVELGGKRVKRLEEARKQKDLAQWDYEAARLDALSETCKAFVETLAAQEQVALGQNTVTVAEQVVAAVSARVEAGKSSPLETTKAETQLASARIAQDKAVRDLDVARAQLAASWGSTTPEFERVAGDFEALEPVAPYEELVQSITKNPDLARWVDELEARHAALRLEKSQRIPDVSATLGFRTKAFPSHRQKGWSADTSGVSSYTSGRTDSSDRTENLLVFEIGVPLPIFDRNQGGIKEAECEASRAHLEQRQAEVHAHSSLYVAHKTLLESHSAAVTLRDEVLPRAQDTFERTQEGYRQGKFGYLDTLDAQRTLYEVRAQYLEALKAYHLATADVDRLIGETPADGKDPSPTPGPNSKEVQHEQR